MSLVSSVSHVSQSVYNLIQPNKTCQKIEMPIFYHIIDENLQICTDFSQLSWVRKINVLKKRNPHR